MPCNFQCFASKNVADFPFPAACCKQDWFPVFIALISLCFITCSSREFLFFRSIKICQKINNNVKRKTLPRKYGGNYRLDCYFKKDKLLSFPDCVIIALHWDFFNLIMFILIF